MKDTHADPSYDPPRFVTSFTWLATFTRPLHCTTNGDRGGNCVPLTFFKSKAKPNADTTTDSDDYAPNLHGIWDKEVIEKSAKARGLTTAQAYANALDLAFAPEFPMWKSAGIHINAWAIDSCTR